MEQPIAFGIYRPVVPELLPVVQQAALLACQNANEWLGAELFVPRMDFGITYASKRSVGHMLLLLQADGRTFPMDDFMTGIRQRIRPDEPDVYDAGPPRPIRPDARARGGLSLGFENEQHRKALSEQSSTVRAIFRSLKLGWAEPTYGHANHLTLANYKGGRRVFNDKERTFFKTQIRSGAKRAGLASIQFGRLVIGAGYSNPLPGSME